MAETKRLLPWSIVVGLGHGFLFGLVFTLADIDAPAYVIVGGCTLFHGFLGAIAALIMGVPADAGTAITETLVEHRVRRVREKTVEAGQLSYSARDDQGSLSTAEAEPGSLALPPRQQG